MVLENFLERKGGLLKGMRHKGEVAFSTPSAGMAGEEKTYSSPRLLFMTLMRWGSTWDGNHVHLTVMATKLKDYTTMLQYFRDTTRTVITSHPSPWNTSRPSQCKGVAND